MFGPECDNQVVQDELVENIINSVLNGFNATVFAYGQTASGENKYEILYFSNYWQLSFYKGHLVMTNRLLLGTNIITLSPLLNLALYV